MTTTSEDPQTSTPPSESALAVVVSPTAHVKMVLHAAQNPTTCIHGALIGSTSKDDGSLKIEDAVPVCHEPPSAPLIDMALRLLPSERTLIGWYTASELLGSTHADPAAQRIVASMYKSQELQPQQDMVLVVLDNEGLAEFLGGSNNEANAMTAFLAKEPPTSRPQWTRLVPIKVESPLQSGDAARTAFQQDAPRIFDFVDLLEAGNIKEMDWPANAAVEACIAKQG